MDEVVLGRTGLKVSIAGLGCGGHGRLGLSNGATEAQALAVVQRALDLGVTFVDTARAYGNEGIVGKALRGRRDQVVVSTKAAAHGPRGGVSARELTRSLRKSLRRLRTDHVDVFHLHGVRPQFYDHCVGELVPAMMTLRDQGKLRFLAISEAFGTDPGHSMLQRAVTDDCWDVMMVGFNMLNPSARERVLPATIAKDVGVLAMFAVRNAMSTPGVLREVVGSLVVDGLVDAEEIDADDPLGFLVRPDGASSVVDAAYRFVRHEPGTHVVLTGTGKVEHLEANIASINRGPLPAADLESLQRLFGAVDHVTGN